MVIRDLAAAGRGLIEFPLQEHEVEEDPRRRFREVPKHGYRLIYRVQGDRVVVVAVIHGSRRLSAGLFDRLG